MSLIKNVLFHICRHWYVQSNAQWLSISYSIRLNNVLMQISIKGKLHWFYISYICLHVLKSSSHMWKTLYKAFYCLKYVKLTQVMSHEARLIEFEEYKFVNENIQGCGFRTRPPLPFPRFCCRTEDWGYTSCYYSNITPQNPLAELYVVKLLYG